MTIRNYQDESIVLPKKLMYLSELKRLPCGLVFLHCITYIAACCEPCQSFKKIKQIVVVICGHYWSESTVYFQSFNGGATKGIWLAAIAIERFWFVGWRGTRQSDAVEIGQSVRGFGADGKIARPLAESRRNCAVGLRRRTVQQRSRLPTEWKSVETIYVQKYWQRRQWTFSSRHGLPIQIIVAAERFFRIRLIIYWFDAWLVFNLCR